MTSTMTIAARNRAPDTLTDWMRERRSIRRYRAEPLPRGTDRAADRRRALCAVGAQPAALALRAAAGRASARSGSPPPWARGCAPTARPTATTRKRSSTMSRARTRASPRRRPSIVACLTLADMDRYPDARRARGRAADGGAEHGHGGAEPAAARARRRARRVLDVRAAVLPGHGAGRARRCRPTGSRRRWSRSAIRPRPAAAASAAPSPRSCDHDGLCRKLGFTSPIGREPASDLIGGRRATARRVRGYGLSRKS